MFINEIIDRNAEVVLQNVSEGSTDLVVTDPRYLVNYRDRSGRYLKNDANPAGVLPVFEPLAQTMKQDSDLVSDLRPVFSSKMR